MPFYEYVCKSHGPFTERASLADFDKPQNCPECEKSSPRNLMSTPEIGSNGERRKPKNATATGRKVKHAPGCPCCS